MEDRAWVCLAAPFFHLRRKPIRPLLRLTNANKIACARAVLPLQSFTSLLLYGAARPGRLRKSSSPLRERRIFAFGGLTMRRKVPLLTVLLIVGGAALAALSALRASDPPAKQNRDRPETARAERLKAPAVKPKPLSNSIEKGLAYLVSQQHENGGWGQGGGWRNDLQGTSRIEGANVSDPPDVANTCITTLALLRVGHTPKEGNYANNLARAVDFICKNI